MNKITVTTNKQLNALYNESALTWEGMNTDEENLKAIEEWLQTHGAIIDGKSPIFHIIKGEFMNAAYGLSGTNAYPEDLNIISVTDIDQIKIALARFEVGGRWFDDIVDNNARREEEMK